MYKFTEYYTDKTSIESTGTVDEVSRKFENCVGMGIACSIVELNREGVPVKLINFCEDETMDNLWWMNKLV